MSESEFIAFPKIEQLGRIWVTVTQKIHGSNGQILIYDYESVSGCLKTNIKAGSRTRWLTPEDDNYGFAKWVEDNRDELIKKLGVGRHYGEWCGLGINSGEGLSAKMFVLFDWFRYADSMKITCEDGEVVSSFPYLMEGLRTVPVLYKGIYSDARIQQVMDDLKSTGSHLTPPGWFMRPEGIVIDINGTKYKRVFEQEDTAWKKSDKPKVERIKLDVSHLLQPIRLEKLLSRDERYRREYPHTLSDIVKDYFADLVNEGQVIKEDEQFDNIRKSLAPELYKFVQHWIETLDNEWVKMP